jgi:poly(3-hydroxybutyrate) depolymerase
MRIIDLPMKAAFSLSCVAVTAFAALSGCHRGQLALVDHPRNFPGVVSKDVTFYSSALDRKMTYRVYRPEDVPARTKLPAIYLLHGCGTSFRDWSNYSDVGAYAAKGLILVMVDGACSYYVNAALNPKDKYEDYFVHDLISDAESRFSVLSDRENRAVVGVSMGGALQPLNWPSLGQIYSPLRAPSVLPLMCPWSQKSAAPRDRRRGGFGSQPDPTRQSHYP